MDKHNEELIGIPQMFERVEAQAALLDSTTADAVRDLMMICRAQNKQIEELWGMIETLRFNPILDANRKRSD